MDDITKSRIEKLHPSVRDEVYKIIEEVDSALTGKAKFRMSQGLRTIDEQDGLYALGRTKPGKKVTNAKGGSSYHNYGLAVDFCLMVDNKVEWSMTEDFDGDHIADWKEVVNIFKKHGWSWGGEWISLKDYPHFEKSFGYTVKQLKQKYDSSLTFIENGVKYVKL